MKRLIAGAGIVAALAAPSVAAAKPSKADRQEARQECRTLLDAAGSRANLAVLVDAGRRSAFRSCVRTQARDAARERRSARAQAVEECRAERAEDADGFRAEYEQRGEGIGRCVARKRRAIAEEQDAADAERAALVAQCSEFSGREFGHCVARAASDGHGQQGLDQADQAPQNGDRGQSGDHGGGGADTGTEHSADGRGNAPFPVPPAS